MQITDLSIRPGQVSAKLWGASLLDSGIGFAHPRFRPQTILITYADGHATTLLQGRRVGAPGLLCATFDSRNDGGLVMPIAPAWVRELVHQYATAAGAWVMPVIPPNANGFRVLRVLSGEHVQPYMSVEADTSTPDDVKRVMHFGRNAVREILNKAAKIGVVGPMALGTLDAGPVGERGDGLPYAILELVDEERETINTPVFGINTHAAFLWWSSLLGGLTPVEMVWTRKFPEDVTVLLPLTVDQAGELYHLALHALMGARAAGDEGDDLPARSALDTLYRLREIARHERGQRAK